MPKRSTHPQNALTAVGVRNLKKPGRYADGGGLYLHVRKSGAKNWLLRLTVKGGRQDIGLGGVANVTLSEAREEATRLRRLARNGGDPKAERRRERVSVPTFEEAARKVHADRLPTWRNPKHAAQWISTLERYAFPKIGERAVNGISSGDILKVLAPIWLDKAETARRLRQRIAAVFDWARAAEHIEGVNPCDGVTQGLPKQPERGVNHHAAMAYDDVPGFLQKRLPDLRIGPSAKLALEFLVLTASRTNEVLGARWDEIDLAEGVWTVPADRMKAGKEHRTPLSDRALALLREAKTLSDGGEYVFPGAKAGRPLSNMTLSMAHRRAGLDVTPHGYRSSFRDWAAERTAFPHEVVEAALAHTVEDKVVAAYRRTDFFEKRRQLMQAWSDFVCRPKGAVIALATTTR